MHFTNDNCLKATHATLGLHFLDYSIGRISRVPLTPIELQ